MSVNHEGSGSDQHSVVYYKPFFLPSYSVDPSSKIELGSAGVHPSDILTLDGDDQDAKPIMDSKSVSLVVDTSKIGRNICQGPKKAGCGGGKPIKVGELRLGVAATKKGGPTM
ncbi:hypothetical protein Hypma_000283 [Hypsizygus marmoreus]|uniref:Uncharacterized protein n=1 Tax=Hypsizygus marmoreus TaxID=39966 RepID=A0A369JB28_HYPMA|nr:hypothetical protein Hypma_000283 [Hypsizygus marmoreus]